MAIDFLAREKSIEDVVLVDCGWPYINMPHLNLSSSWFTGIWRFGRGAFRKPPNQSFVGEVAIPGHQSKITIYFLEGCVSSNGILKFFPCYALAPSVDHRSLH